MSGSSALLARVHDHVVVSSATEIGSGDPDEASFTFLGTEPMRILRLVGDDRLVRYATVGCSAHPMGDPSALVADPDGPRAELFMDLRGGVDAVAKTLAVLASTPAIEGLVLQEAALLDTGEPLWPGSSFTGVVLRASRVPDLPHDSGAPVVFLRAVPVTLNESAWVRLRGAEELEAAWEEAGIDPTDPYRPAAAPR